jgi:hypothetical protein
MTHSELAVPTTQLDPQRMAWGVLLLGFAVFCVVCIVTGLGLHWFLFESVVPLTSRLEVGRGTAGIILLADPVEQVARSQFDLSGSIGTTISTDAQSQAMVSFRDSGTLVSSVTLRSNSSFVLREAVSPRFLWSTVGSYTVLDNFTGEVDVFVADDYERAFLLNIRTPQNHQIYFNQGGRYTVSASNSQVQVVNYDGQAILAVRGSSEGISISPGSQGIISADDSHVVALLPYSDLLAVAAFPQSSDVNGGSEPPPDISNTWICSNGETDNPRGDYAIEEMDGRAALRLIRGDGLTDSHGDTRCIKWFGQGGQNVEDAGFLELQVNFRIMAQNLAACGFEGSECPLMLRMDYIDRNNQPRRWIHGFFTRSDPQQNYPLRCNSCTLDHEFVSAGYWYTYKTGNLVTLFPDDQKIRSILNIQFYASGHHYDVYVSDVVFFVGQTIRNG